MKTRYELAENIACTRDMETYYIMGVEVEQDELIVALADEYDTPGTRQDIDNDGLDFENEETAHRMFIAEHSGRM
jgi:hypothetical protein